MPQKAAYTFQQFLFGIDMEKLRSRQRIARKKAFVEHLSAAKGATGNIPGQMKEFDTLACCGRVGGKALFDLGSQRVWKSVSLRAHHEAARAQVAGFPPSRIGGHEQIPGDFDRQLRWTHDTPSSLLASASAARRQAFMSSCTS